MAFAIAALVVNLVLTTIRFLGLDPPARLNERRYLALLAAAALIANFAFLRDGSPRLQRLRGWSSAVAVTVSLYLMFGAIASVSKAIQDTDIVSLI